MYGRQFAASQPLLATVPKQESEGTSEGTQSQRPRIRINIYDVHDNADIILNVRR
jgi:hypothetical protein